MTHSRLLATICLAVPMLASGIEIHRILSSSTNKGSITDLDLLGLALGLSAGVNSASAVYFLESHILLD